MIPPLSQVVVFVCRKVAFHLQGVHCALFLPPEADGGERAIVVHNYT